MCNAWNHSPGCNCGWGGNGGGFFINLSSSLPKTTSDENDYEQSETYLIQCWWCGAFVFYHTNGYGDSVLFDSLGYPWEIHSCWETYWRTEKDRRRVINYLLHDSNQAEQKRMILMGAVRKIKGVTFGRLGFYGATEEAVACQLGLSVSQLRLGYSDIYKVDSAGIRLISKLEQINTPQIVKINKNTKLAEYTETRSFKTDCNYQLKTNFKKWDYWLQGKGFKVLKFKSATRYISKIIRIQAFSTNKFKDVDYRIEIDFYENFNSYYAKVKLSAFASQKSEAKNMVETFFKAIENLVNLRE